MDVFVVVPRLAVEEELHETHTTLDKAPGDEATGAVFLGLILVDAVKLLGGLAFIVDIEGFLGGGLHAGGEFEAGDARLKRILVGQRAGLVGIDVAEEIQKIFLRGTEQMRGRVEVEDARFLGAEHSALKEAGQPAVAPVVIAVDRFAAGVLQHHVGWQLIIFAAEAVSEPRAEAGPADDARDAGVDVAD